jgi:putative flavoprotein involved in K+ transport
MDRYVLVIGAGQAGLAAGFHLRRAGLPFIIVEGSNHVGDVWRNRYDSLTLFTTRQFSTLPGLQIPGNRDGYANRDDFAEYLEAYARHFELPVKLGSYVSRLAKSADGFEANLSNGEIIAASEVLIATGSFQVPIVPPISAELGYEVLQLTAGTFRNCNQLPDGPVLVVGDGASGRDIAIESRKRQPVLLSVGKPRKLLPEHILGKSTWWWLNLVGALEAPATSFRGRMVRKTDAFPDRNLRDEVLQKRGVRLMSRLVGAEADVVKFSDGKVVQIRTVIWAVGYRDETDWVDIKGAVDAKTGFLHTEGVSPVKGLYFVGRPWQRSRSSALIMGAWPDAASVIRKLAADH